jgi:hypothetical protein
MANEYLVDITRAGWEDLEPGIQELIMHHGPSKK